MNDTIRNQRRIKLVISLVQEPLHHDAACFPLFESRFDQSFVPSRKFGQGVIFHG